MHPHTTAAACASAVAGPGAASDAALKAVTAPATQLLAPDGLSEDDVAQAVPRVDPTLFRAPTLSPLPLTSAELAEWQTLVRSGAFPVLPSTAASPLPTDQTANACKRKLSADDTSAAAVPPSASASAAAALVSPSPRLVRAILALWARSSTLETIELAHCEFSPAAVALFCAALSGLDARRTGSRVAPSTSVGGGALHTLSIAWNGDGAFANSTDGPSGAWHIAQWLCTNASLRSLELMQQFPVSATDLADLCDALVARRDAYGATLEHLDISHNRVFIRPPTQSKRLAEYERALERIAAFGPRNASSDRLCSRSVDGRDHSLRCHFPVALQSVAMHFCGDLTDGLKALRAAGRSGVRIGDEPPAGALASLSARFFVTPDNAQRMSEWLCDGDCTLRTVSSSWAPTANGANPLAVPALSAVLTGCALFANASLTELHVVGHAPLRNVEFVVLAAVRTHPTLRRLHLEPARTAADRTIPFGGAHGFASVVAALEVAAPCAELLSRFTWVPTDLTALLPSARTQALAEVLAFGSDHLEDVAAQGLFGLVNGTHIALAQRWVTSGECHTAVCDPVRTAVAASLDGTAAATTTTTAVLPAATPSAPVDAPPSYASMGAIDKRLGAAQSVARFSSLKRLVIGGDMAALIALRTALSPSRNGVLSRSLETLVLRFPPALAPADDPSRAPLSAADRAVGPLNEANPWLTLGTDAEAAAAFDATGRFPLSSSVLMLFHDGLRDNTALTDLTLAGHPLTDTAVAALLFQRFCLDDPGAPPANRSLRCVRFSDTAFSASCLPAIARLVTDAARHGLRELHIAGNQPPLPRRDVEAVLVPALTALRRAGGAWFACRLTGSTRAVVSPSISALSDEVQSRAAHATRQWARLAVVLASYRAHRTHQFLANSVQPLLTAIVTLAGLCVRPLVTDVGAA